MSDTYHIDNHAHTEGGRVALGTGGGEGVGRGGIAVLRQVVVGGKGEQIGDVNVVVVSQRGAVGDRDGGRGREGKGIGGETVGNGGV
jgi:hypothetical protein